MKKIAFSLLIVSIMFLGAACTKKDAPTDQGFNLSMTKGEVSQSVKGWSTHTNPAYRYELRYPTDWKVVDSGEDGVQAAFYPAEREAEVKKNKETYYGSVLFLAHINWKDNYTLEEFYRNQLENLFLGNYEQEAIMFDGEEGVWFKDVRNRNLEYPDRLVDVIALELDDRIIEIEIHEKEYWNDIKVMLNSLKFYPGKIMADLEVKAE